MNKLKLLLAGSFVSVGLSSLCFVPFSAAQSFIPELYRHDPITVNVPVHSGWNMLSNPVRTTNDTVISLFPTCWPWVFLYDHQVGYYQSNRLPFGIGVWHKCIVSGTAHITGELVSCDSFEVSQGWNLVGSISYPIPSERVSSSPPGIIISSFWYHNGTYVTADTIRPGFSYYVKASDNGKIILAVPPFPRRP